MFTRAFGQMAVCDIVARISRCYLALFTCMHSRSLEKNIGLYLFGRPAMFDLRSTRKKQRKKMLGVLQAGRQSLAVLPTGTGALP